MRHVAVASVAILLGMATQSSAQHTMPPAPGDCCGGHHVSTQPCDYHGCCPPLIPTIGRGIHNFFTCLFPCHGCNYHQAVYHEALRRNGSRGRCCLPGLPLISIRFGHCGCGHDPCGCGPAGEMASPPMMETYEDPPMMPQPVPSAEQGTEQIGPPPQNEQGASNTRAWKNQTVTRRRSARGARTPEPPLALRDASQQKEASQLQPRTFAPEMARQLPRETTKIRTVSGTASTTVRVPNNPLR